MAIDWFGHGLIPSKWSKEPGRFELKARRVIGFDRKTLDRMVKYAIKRLQSELPEYEIEVKQARGLFGRGIEIQGKHKKSEQSSFWIKYTCKKMYAKIYGLDPEIVMNCAL